MLDIISVNIYPQWYLDDDVTDYYQRVKEYTDSCFEGKKPFIVSECGAGAIYGYRSFTNSKWTENKQCEILERLITDLGSRDEISGVVIWQYSDCRVDEEIFASRPKMQNNKGIVDLYRNPKMSYYTVKKCFSQLKPYKD